MHPPCVANHSPARCLCLCCYSSPLAFALLVLSSRLARCVLPLACLLLACFSPLRSFPSLFAAFNAFLFILVVLICLTVGALLKKYRYDRYFPSSAAAIVLGFLIGAFLNLSPSVASVAAFSPEIFFFLLLPPIMIEAGYTLKRKQFFKNFGTISLYAFAGTFVTCMAFGLLLYVFAAARLIPLEGNNPIECLIFGALISATDPVAVLAMLNSPEVKVPPTLYALIFGESILNDAIAIVLFNTFKNLIPNLDPETNRPLEGDASQAQFTFIKFMGAIASFLWISIGSTVVGFLVAFVCSFITRHVSFKNYPAYEVTLIILFAWLSYFLNEALRLSGIMGIFFTAVGLAHYAYYNISPKAQLATHEAFKSVAQVAETFVFAYIGIAVGMSIAVRPLKWDLGMILLSIVICFVARAVHVFPLTFLANRNRKEKIPINMQIPIWWAGLRGAVAVALSFSFPLGKEDDGNMPYVVTSTLGIVLTTTIICGGTTVQVLDACGMNAPRPSLAEQDATGGSGEKGETSDEHGHGAHEEDDSVHDMGGERTIKAVGRFRKFDRTFMRKWFGGNVRSSMLAEDQPTIAELGGAAHGQNGAGEAAGDGSYLAPSGVWEPHSRSEEHEDALPAQRTEEQKSLDGQ